MGKTAKSAGDLSQLTGSSKGMPSTSANRPAWSSRRRGIAMMPSSVRLVELGEDHGKAIAQRVPAQEYVEVAVAAEQVERTAILEIPEEVVVGVDLALRQKAEISIPGDQGDPRVRSGRLGHEIGRQVLLSFHRDQVPFLHALRHL